MGGFSDFLTDLARQTAPTINKGIQDAQQRERDLADQSKAFDQMAPRRLKFQQDLSTQQLPYELTKILAARQQKPVDPRIEARNQFVNYLRNRGTTTEKTFNPELALAGQEPVGSVTKDIPLDPATVASHGVASGVKMDPTMQKILFPQQANEAVDKLHYFSEPGTGTQMVVPQRAGAVAQPVPGQTSQKPEPKMDKEAAARIINDPRSTPEAVDLAKKFLVTLRDYGGETTAVNTAAKINTENRLLEIIKEIAAGKTAATTQANIDVNTNPANVKKLADAAQARAAAIQKGQAVTLPPESLDYFAKSYLTPGSPSFGKIPNFGMGQAGMAARAQLMIRVGEMGQMAGNDPEGLAVKSAAFNGLKTELTNMSSQKGKIMNFMLTNDKNLALAQKLSDAVERSDVPLLNNLLIPYGMKVGGSGDLAAMNAALRVAINETAKVLTSATGAGVLSDASRKEMEHTLNSSMNPKQIRSVIAVLRADMENRSSSYEELGKGILGQMQNLSHGGNSNPTTQSPNPSQGNSPKNNDPLGIRR